MSAASQQSPVSAAPALRLTAEERAVFDRDGFVIRRKFVTDAELAPLAEACLGDPEIDGALVGIADSQGNMQEVVTWTDLTQPDMLTVIPRMARFVDASEDLLGRPVYHWHSKLSMKRPGSAGRWDWHQDYAYWYRDGCLTPDMLTITVAVDPAREDNGCMQIIPRSHELGRIDHPSIGKSSAVDPERLAEIQRRYSVVACVMDPGDALFFHGNLLHASGPNQSDGPRTLLHCTYNAISNAPFRTEGQRDHQYSPIPLVGDDVILEGRYASAFDHHPFPRLSADRKTSRYGGAVLSVSESGT